MHALMVVALVASAQPTSADEVVAKAFADAPAATAAPREAPPSPTGRLFGWGLALTAVAAVTAMALKRKAQTPARGFAEVAQNLSVGSKRSLLVVTFAGKRLLVGATDGGFAVLASEPLIAGTSVSESEFDALIEKAKEPEVRS